MREWCSTSDQIKQFAFKFVKYDELAGGYWSIIIKYCDLNIPDNR